ncbi:MAG: conjugative relaxase-like TrwC/TraI family protein [Ilumatobacter sp.]|jgi:conjugative relaxase-like TrwC/TraI family protein
MIRVTTLYASGAGASAEYYTGYLTKADGELPGVWTGSQAPGLGLSGEVTTESLEALLSGHDPSTGMQLGRALVDRFDKHGNTIKAVAGYDATLSAPKSLSVLWGLTGDDGWAECHDVAVNAVVDMIEKYGSTTRIRSNGTRLHPETQGLSVAVFRQSTSRADDPQLHTHVVISAKVQTADGRWYALDALTLKKYQQAFGYLYQSTLRAEVTHRYGVVFDPIVNGQAEIAGVSSELLDQLSKRAREIGYEMDDKLADFHIREGRDPSAFEYAAMEREAAVDTRSKKTGATVSDLRTRWGSEAARLGIDSTTLTASIAEAARQRPIEASPLAVSDVIEELATRKSTWNRMDVLRTICDTVTPQPGHDGTTWATALDQAVDRVLASCIDLDPETDRTLRRSCDGRSLYLEPITNQSTSEHVLAQEEHILTWALGAQAGDPIPSHTIRDDALDDGQHDAASAVAGHDRLVLVVGPAGAGKTRMLQAAVTDLDTQTRPVIGFAPTAKAARVLETETGMPADTVAKLLYELDHPDPERRPWFDCGPGTTVIVDEAGMLNTADLHRLVIYAETHQWRLALVGDPHQLQAVGRGGMFQELCDTGRTIELEHLHRFTNEWEAANSLRLRQGDPDALHFYNTFGRIGAGSFDDHLDTITAAWTQCRDDGETISITTCRNEHVHAINRHIQQRRVEAGELDQNTLAQIADDWAMAGDVVATRRNDRRLRTTTGEPIRNRERWTITDTNQNGEITVTRFGGHGTITLPADYVRQYVQLAYATTEHGAQGETADRSITLATTATTGRGLYVGMTRGRDENVALVVTEGPDVAEAISILEAAIAIDRADIPATTHRRTLAATVPRSRARPRVKIPDWFDDLRATAQEQLRIAQQALDGRNAERAADEKLAADARRDLPATKAAHAPFEEKVKAAQQAVGEARSDLRSTERESRASDRIHRRSGRRRVKAASDVLAVAEEHLLIADQLAAPTRAPLDDLQKIIDDQRRFDSARRILDNWDHLDGAAERAEALCLALDGWKNWADGRDVSPTDLTVVATMLRDHQELPGVAQAAESLARWAGPQGVGLQRHHRPMPSIEMGLEL